jgi:hypothetical protein
MEYYSAIKNKVLIHAEVGWGGGWRGEMMGAM